MSSKSTQYQTKTSSCALYMRLSKEDDKGSESASIETQRKILQSYARENHLLIHDEYVDDGYSGTTMDRPAFRQMQEDIETGKINVVLTKDLSRLGRNSGRVNLLIDEYFPLHRVRYISVSEGIDTAQRTYTNNIVTPMHNFVNELYAADISGKIHAALDIKMQEGEFIGAFAPFGYSKDPTNKNHLVVDKTAATMVKEIFALAAAGHSPRQIAAILNEKAYPTPSQYRYAKNPHLPPTSFTVAKEWQGQTVSKILRNEVYLGHTVQGKTAKPTFKSKFTYAKPKAEWITVQNTHEPLISEETWNTVRKKLQSRSQKREKGFVNLFSGLAKCADCSKNMSTVGTRKKGTTANLNCGGYKLAGKKACTNHTIGYDTLYQAVLKALQEQIHFSKAEKQRLLAEMLAETATQGSSSQEELEKQLEVINNKLEQLYDDKYNGTIDKEQFEQLQQRYQKEKNACQKKLAAYQAREKQRNNQEDLQQRFCQFQELIDQYTDLESLDSDLLFTLIDRIEVHQGEYINGVKQQQIDIYFKFQYAPK
ncbi:MAG: recombinase family protein [Peptococcaceae bacterium]|nr:recombinase family protein [Peptococcaceae bacterium]